MPGETGVRTVAIAGLTEVGRPSIKLPPADGEFVPVCRGNRNRRLICGIADDVVPIRIDVGLVTSEDTIGRDHPGRTVQLVKARRRRRYPGFFKRLREAPLGYWH